MPIAIPYNLPILLANHTPYPLAFQEQLGDYYYLFLCAPACRHFLLEWVRIPIDELSAPAGPR